MKILKNHLKAVIFDMDGTIINSANKWDNAIVNCIRSLNISKNQSSDDSLLSEINGGSLYDVAHKIKATFKIQHTLKDIVEKIKELAHTSFDNSIGFIPGFENFQKILSENSVKHGIATNADLQSFNKFIDTFGFQKMFGEHLYSIDHIGGVAKPDPAIFLHTAEKLEVAPQDCIVFEDSIYGFLAAKAAGMRCIAIKNDKNHKHFNLVHGAINGYDEAIKVLYKLFNIKT